MNKGSEMNKGPLPLGHTLIKVFYIDINRFSMICPDRNVQQLKSNFHSEIPHACF